MQTKSIRQLTKTGAVAGLTAVVCYFFIAFIPLSLNLTFLLAMIFPVGLIVFFFALKEYIGFNGGGYSNKLFFLFSSFACLVAAIMLAAQITVQAEAAKMKGVTSLQTTIWLVRQVDLGLDVAWDVFISTGMILFGISTLKLPVLKWCGVISIVFGLLLLLLNIIAFPEPPADKGLPDMGPFIALFWIMLQIRMLVLVHRPEGN